MTREEIKQVAENYASQMCNDCSSMFYCKDKNMKCVERREREKVFADGAKWAEKQLNLSSLWHQASEEPAGRGWRIICQDEEGKYWIKDWADVIQIHYIWNEYVKAEMIVKWAYLDELLK